MSYDDYVIKTHRKTKQARPEFKPYVRAHARGKLTSSAMDSSKTNDEVKINAFSANSKLTKKSEPNWWGGDIKKKFNNY